MFTREEFFLQNSASPMGAPRISMLGWFDVCIDGGKDER